MSEVNIEINEEQFTKFAVDVLIEDNQTKFNINGPDSTTDYVFDNLRSLIMDSDRDIDSYDDAIIIQGWCRNAVPEVVGRIPASGGGKFDPPTNPPEVITEDRDFEFELRFKFENLGVVELSAFVM